MASADAGLCCPNVPGDGLDAFFASDRPGGAGGFDLYESTRVCN